MKSQIMSVEKLKKKYLLKIENVGSIIIEYGIKGLTKLDDFSSRIGTVIEKILKHEKEKRDNTR